MDALKARLREIGERIDALSVRERGMVFIGVLALLYLVGFNVIFAPLRAQHTMLDRELKTRYEQIHASDQQVNALLSGAEQGSTQNRQRIEALTQQLQSLDTEMDRMTAGVVTPKEMAKLIEQMLTRNRNLDLVRLEALPSVPIDQDAKPSAGHPTSADGMVYRHAMRIEFKGRYADIVDYLKTLEGLQWKVFWGEVSLETDKYPISKVSLVIYTLSRYPNWIGV